MGGLIMSVGGNKKWVKGAAALHPAKFIRRSTGCAEYAAPKRRPYGGDARWASRSARGDVLLPARRPAAPGVSGGGWHYRAIRLRGHQPKPYFPQLLPTTTHHLQQRTDALVVDIIGEAIPPVKYSIAHRAQAPDRSKRRPSPEERRFPGPPDARDGWRGYRFMRIIHVEITGRVGTLTTFPPVP